MLFINNNHFKLIIKDDYKKNQLIIQIIKNNDLKNLLNKTINQ